MTDTKIINSPGNITIQHRTDTVKRSDALGITLELIKTLAGSGTYHHQVDEMLNNLGKWTDLIHEEMKKNKVQ